MLLTWKKFVVMGAIALTIVPSTSGFSLLGPGGAEGIAAKLWQLPADNANWDIGYALAGDIGAPVAPDEAYRLNIPVLTYGFDEAFLQFFGIDGIHAIDSAFRILNDLPPVSTMSDDLGEFPLSASHINHEAAQLGLLDLKSATLSLLLEEMGVTDSVRWNYSIRHREPIPGTDFGVYNVIKFNYDPVTIAPSSYVNGTLYTYHILEIPPPVMYSEAVEDLPASTSQDVNLPVSALSSFQVLSGFYFSSLTRDDVGALRFLYHPRRVVGETLLPGITQSGGALTPFLGTNVFTNIVIGGTNSLGTNGLTAGYRGGINKVRFQRVQYSSLGFIPLTQTYKDRVSFRGEVFEQTVQRTVTIPDIIFTVGDLLTTLALRTDTSAWVNNEALNGFTLNGGPGVITPPITITYNKQLPQKINITPSLIFEPFITDPNARAAGLLSPTWATFDGTTNPPIIYPQYTIDTIRNLARGAGL